MCHRDCSQPLKVTLVDPTQDSGPGRLFLFLAGLEVSSLPPVWSFSQTFWMNTEPVGGLRHQLSRQISDQQINFHRGTKEIYKKVFLQTFQFIFCDQRDFHYFHSVPDVISSYSGKNISHIFVILISSLYLKSFFYIDWDFLHFVVELCLAWGIALLCCNYFLPDFVLFENYLSSIAFV